MNNQPNSRDANMRQLSSVRLYQDAVETCEADSSCSLRSRVEMTKGGASGSFTQDALHEDTQWAFGGIWRLLSASTIPVELRGIILKTLNCHLGILTNLDEVSVGITHVAAPFPSVGVCKRLR